VKPKEAEFDLAKFSRDELETFDELLSKAYGTALSD
jgi:hypothetical protein